MPLTLWNELALGRLASVIGIPIKMDVPTVNCKRLAFSRILVESSTMRCPLAQEVRVCLREGRRLVITVTYEWIPQDALHVDVLGMKWFTALIHRVNPFEASCWKFCGSVS